jgi:hypothetical protein
VAQLALEDHVVTAGATPTGKVNRTSVETVDPDDDLL